MTKDFNIVPNEGGEQFRLVLLEHDEHFLMQHQGRGYVLALPYLLCKHQHKRMDAALRCGLKEAAKRLDTPEGK